MKSAAPTASGEASSQRTTLLRMRRARSLKPRASKFWRRIARPRGCWSTKVTLAAPRESASMPRAPEPANRSSTSAPSMRRPTMLKIACLTMPWVGRMFLGALRRRPRASPPATRSLDIYLVLDADLAVAPHGPDPARGWHLALEACPSAGRNRDQQASAGLRVAHHQTLDL